MRTFPSIHSIASVITPILQSYPDNPNFNITEGYIKVELLPNFIDCKSDQNYIKKTDRCKSYICFWINMFGQTIMDPKFKSCIDAEKNGKESFNIADNIKKIRYALLPEDYKASNIDIAFTFERLLDIVSKVIYKFMDLTLDKYILSYIKSYDMKISVYDENEKLLQTYRYGRLDRLFNVEMYIIKIVSYGKEYFIVDEGNHVSVCEKEEIEKEDRDYLNINSKLYFMPSTMKLKTLPNLPPSILRSNILDTNNLNRNDYNKVSNKPDDIIDYYTDDHGCVHDIQRFISSSIINKIKDRLLKSSVLPKDMSYEDEDSIEYDIYVGRATYNFINYLKYENSNKKLVYFDLTDERLYTLYMKHSKFPYEEYKSAIRAMKNVNILNKELKADIKNHFDYLMYILYTHFRDLNYLTLYKSNKILERVVLDGTTNNSFLKGFVNNPITNYYNINNKDLTTRMIKHRNEAVRLFDEIRNLFPEEKFDINKLKFSFISTYKRKACLKNVYSSFFKIFIMDVITRGRGIGPMGCKEFIDEMSKYSIKASTLEDFYNNTPYLKSIYDNGIINIRFGVNLKNQIYVGENLVFHKFAEINPKECNNLYWSSIHSLPNIHIESSEIDDLITIIINALCRYKDNNKDDKFSIINTSINFEFLHLSFAENYTFEEFDKLIKENRTTRQCYITDDLFRRFDFYIKHLFCRAKYFKLF